VIGSSFGADMWDRQQHEAILKNVQTVIERLSAVGGRTLGTSVGSARRRKTEQDFDAQADLLRKIMAMARTTVWC